ncbi:MAG: T9SS C-terminal target domain-containing protein [Ignavibacteriae bacterium]|nr:MAG: T9SS C-terminal target domain-containing protein [Ignavibacteriota bacterium]
MKTNSIYTKIIISLLLLISSGISLHAQNYEWSGLGSNSAGFGVNGNVYAVTIYNGTLIVGGGFTLAGNVNVSNIAAWNGTTWSALGSGISDTVYALEVFNNELYAGGIFLQAGGQNISRIAKWNGTSWSPVGTGANDEVQVLKVYNSELVAGGQFSNIGNNIAKWNGSSWSQLGSGVDDDVFALTVYNSNLVAAGRFTNVGDKIARWNGSTWTSLSNNTSDRIHALGVHNSLLVAGGRFTSIGGVNANYIAVYNGTSWSGIGSGLDDRVYAIGSVNGNLVAGGNFKYAGSLYVDRIAMWNGSSWQRMSTGMNNKVNAITVKDTILYAGGEFITAGGRVINHIAQWSKPALTHSISGVVKYNDNNQPVINGRVRAYRMDLNTRELILVDSAVINNGNYNIPKVPEDTLFIMSVPDDELDYVPTFHPSTIDWVTAVRVYASGNLSNVNVNVYRVTPGPQGPALTSVSGHVYLNFLPPPVPGPLPFKSDAYVYARQGNLFRGFAVSTQTEQYMLPSLPPGTYDIYVNRIGYTAAFTNIVISSASIDTLNFTLDTTSITMGVNHIGSKIPENFMLRQNYPNPFNPSTKIIFELPEKSNIKLSVFNILGEEVAVLAEEEAKAGSNEVIFNAVKLSSGIYFYRLIATGQSYNYTETKKMILVK